MSWPENVDLVKKVFVCQKCGGELSQEDRRVGEWVKKWKDKEYSGYWISLLMAPWVTAQEIITYKETKGEEFFYNFVLGLPYVGQGNTVTPDIIFRNCTSNINGQEGVVIGSDSGLKKHYVCGNREGLFYHGVTEKWEDIARLLKRWPRSIAVIDHLPDITGPRALREQFPGRVFLCHYSVDRKTMQLVRWGKGKEEGNVIVDRNRTIQTVIDEFADERIPLQGNTQDWNPYWQHWKTLYRMTEEDNLGVPRSKWLSSNGEDHWVHATVYWRAGMQRFGGGKASFVSKNNSNVSFARGVEFEPDGTFKNNPLKL